MEKNSEISEVIDALSVQLAEAAKTGGRLPPERRLAEMLGTSRRRLRLALDELHRRGVVFRRHGQGTFVTPPPHPDTGRFRLLAGRVTLEQLMDVRRQIEPRLAELAALSASKDEIEQLETLMQKTRNAVTAREYDLADEVFHYRIAELAGNALFLEVYDLIREMRRESGWRERRAQTNLPGVIARLGEQHLHIFTAIADHDPIAAGNAVRAHLSDVTSAMTSAY